MSKYRGRVQANVPQRAHTGHRLPRGWRALAVAIPVWPVAWVAVGSTPRFAAVTAGVFGCSAASALWLWRRGAGGWTAVTAVALVAATAAAISSYLHAVDYQRGPWSELAQRRAVIDVDLVLSSPPRSAQSFQAGPTTSHGRVTAHAQVSAVYEHQAGWSLSDDVWLTAPSHDPPLARGDRVLAEARVKPGDQRRGFAARLEIQQITRVVPGANARTVADELFDRALRQADGQRAALVRGMAIGDDSALTADNRERIRRVGLSHLTAVSGSNLAIVVGFVLLLARLTGLAQSWSVGIAMAVMLFYAWIVGPEPSVLRATAMAVVMLLAFFVGGGAGIAALATAATVLLVWNPTLAASAGFALSVAATAGLIAVAGPGRAWGLRLTTAVPKWAAIPVGISVAAAVTSVAAGLATAPLIAAMGGGWPWVSLLANTLVSALVPLITVIGLIAAGTAAIAPEVAAVMAQIPLWGAGVILGIAEFADAVPMGRVPLPAGWWGALIVAGAIVLVGVAPNRIRKTIAVLCAAVAVATVTLTAVPAAGKRAPAQWALLFCDVGQGDVTVVRTGPTSAMAIDSGPDEFAAADCLKRAGITTVSAIVLTHFHLDHVAGLPALLATGAPQEVWVSPLPEPAEVAEVTAAQLHAAGVMSTPVRVGARMQHGWAEATVLGPDGPIREGSAANNSSVVTRIVVQVPTQPPIAVLLTGDVEPAAQSRLMRITGDPAVDVVKVPHHGSANQHPGFPRWAAAALAIVSCSTDNTYGHPAESTIAAWEQAGTAVRRTDLDGDLYVWRDAENILQVLAR